MPRIAHLRTQFVAASAATIFVVGGGTLLGAPPPGPGAAQAPLVLAQFPAGPPSAKVPGALEENLIEEAVSRGLTAEAGAERPLIRSAGTLPPYRFAPPGEPIAPAAEPEPEPASRQGRVFVPAPEPEPAPVAAPFTVRVGTFNILGSQHTRGSGRWAPGTTRAGFTSELVRSRGLALIGMQEVQRDQLGVIQSRLPGHTVWPAASLGNNGIRLQIAFRNDLFELVGTQTFTTVFHRQLRPIPVVRLRHRATGGEFHVMTLHNSPLGMQAERDAAKAVQIAQINRLRATGLPLIVMGDANEKEAWFCRVGAATGMVAANGGSTSGGCRMPPNAKIDWIMGGGVQFARYVQETGGLVARASDHFLIHADATVAGVVPPRGDTEGDAGSAAGD